MCDAFDKRTLTRKERIGQTEHFQFAKRLKNLRIRVRPNKIVRQIAKQLFTHSTIHADCDAKIRASNDSQNPEIGQSFEHSFANRLQFIVRQITENKTKHDK